jgi:hypothetical protein
MSFTTETLDKAYLEYSNITNAKTAKELRLEQQLAERDELIHKIWKEEWLQLIDTDKLQEISDNFAEKLKKEER